MPNVKISIDDRVLMDGDIGSWTASPPYGVQDLIAKATTKPEPWYPAILAGLQGAILSDRDTVIAVSTKADGWVLEVTDGYDHSST